MSANAPAVNGRAVFRQFMETNTFPKQDMHAAAKAKEPDAPDHEPLPRGRGALPPAVVEASQRRRLLEAMTEMTAAKGLAAVTVADVTARAGVSRRSFYALFKDKSDCYVAGFTANARVLVGAVRQAMQAAGDPADGILDGFRAYLRTLSAQPVHARAYLLEGLRAGPEILVYRERAHRELVELNRRALRRAGGAASARNDNAIVALVGGINELVCRELEHGGDVAALEPDVVDLVVSVLHLDRQPAERP